MLFMADEREGGGAQRGEIMRLGSCCHEVAMLSLEYVWF